MLANQLAGWTADREVKLRSRQHRPPKYFSAGLCRFSLDGSLRIYRSFASHIQGLLELGESSHQQIVHASQPTRLVFGQIAPTRYQQAQLDVEFRFVDDGAQITAGAHLIGDHAGITGVALGFAPAVPGEHG